MRVDRIPGNVEDFGVSCIIILVKDTHELSKSAPIRILGDFLRGRSYNTGRSRCTLYLAGIRSLTCMQSLMNLNNTLSLALNLKPRKELCLSPCTSTSGRGPPPAMYCDCSLEEVSLLVYHTNSSLAECFHWDLPAYCTAISIDERPEFCPAPTLANTKQA